MQADYGLMFTIDINPAHVSFIIKEMLFKTKYPEAFKGDITHFQILPDISLQ